jgi:mRNA interferase HigB
MNIYISTCRTRKEKWSQIANVCYQFGNALYICKLMRAIAVKTLRSYSKKKVEVVQSLLSWYQEAEKANWKNHNELKQQFANASVISNKKVVFNIDGNKYRLIVDIEYHLQIIFIVWIGTHKEYDSIDAKKVSYVKAG